MARVLGQKHAFRGQYTDQSVLRGRIRGDLSFATLCSTSSPKISPAPLFLDPWNQYIRLVKISILSAATAHVVLTYFKNLEEDMNYSLILASEGF